MKKLLILVISLTTLVVGCEERYEFPNEELYINLYMPQANDYPSSKSLMLSDTIQTILYNAYYGGPNAPERDISVTFEVVPALVDSFNLTNATNYPLLPEESYTIDSNAVIPAGKLSSGSLEINIKTKGSLNVFQSYLLPVRIKENDNNIRLNKELKTSYFLITTSFAPGEVPREHVLSLGDGAAMAFKYGDALIVRNTENNMMRYPYNAEDDSFEEPYQIGQGWGVIDIFIPYPDRWVARKTNGEMWQYLWSQDGVFQGAGHVGTGWNIFDLIIGHKGNIYSRNKETGILTRWPYETCFCDGVYSMSGDWASFTQIISYKNTLLGLAPNGDLWEHEVDEEGTLGNVRKVGSGWDMYTKIIPFGDDLLALDENGDLWRYAFDPKGFWALK